MKLYNQVVAARGSWVLVRVSDMGYLSRCSIIYSDGRPLEGYFYLACTKDSDIARELGVSGFGDGSPYIGLDNKCTLSVFSASLHLYDIIGFTAIPDTGDIFSFRRSCVSKRLSAYMDKWYDGYSKIDVKFVLGIANDIDFDIDKRCKEIDDVISSDYASEVTSDFSSMAGFIYDEERHRLVYSGHDDLDVIYAMRHTSESYDFKLSYLHVNAFESCSDNKLVYDISRICPDERFYGVFNVFSSTAVTDLSAGFESGLGAFKEVFDVGIAKELLLHPDNNLLLKLNRLSMFDHRLFNMSGVSPFILYLMCERNYREDGTNYTTGIFGDGNQIVFDTESADIVFVPFDIFKLHGMEAVLEDIDIGKMLRGYEEDFIKLAYYCLLSVTGGGHLGGRMLYNIDLTKKDWEVGYVLNGVDTLVTVKYGEGCS